MHTYLMTAATTGLVVAASLLVSAPATAGPPVAGVAGASSPAIAAAATCGGQAATLVGTAGRDVLRGTPGPDVIFARGGNDVIQGRGGDDVVCAGGGADRIRGGQGDDRLRGGLDRFHHVEEEGWYIAGDILVGGPGDDVLDAGADPRTRGIRTRRDTVSWSTAMGGVTLDLAAGTAVGQGDDTVAAGRLEVRLTPFDDVVQGSGRSDAVLTAAGADVVRAGGGNDAVLVDDGDDTSDDRATGGRGNDALAGRGGGANTLLGGRGRDQLSDRGPDDTLRSGPGRDKVIHPMAYTSGLTLAGGRGRDMLEVAAGLTPDDVASTTVDLAQGTLVHTPEGGEAVAHAAPGFENVNLSQFDEIALSATDDRNRLFVDGDDVTLHALGGDDDLFPCCDGGDHLDGGDGHDRVFFQSCSDNTCVSIEESEE